MASFAYALNRILDTFLGWVGGTFEKVELRKVVLLKPQTNGIWSVCRAGQAQISNRVLVIDARYPMCPKCGHLFQDVFTDTIVHETVEALCTLIEPRARERFHSILIPEIVTCPCGKTIIRDSVLLKERRSR